MLSNISSVELFSSWNAFWMSSLISCWFLVGADGWNSMSGSEWNLNCKRFSESSWLKANDDILKLLSFSFSSLLQVMVAAAPDFLAVLDDDVISFYFLQFKQSRYLGLFWHLSGIILHFLHLLHGTFVVVELRVCLLLHFQDCSCWQLTQ